MATVREIERECGEPSPSGFQSFTIDVSCVDPAGDASLGRTTVTFAKRGIVP